MQQIITLILLMNLTGHKFRQDIIGIVSLYSRRCGAWAGKTVDWTKWLTSKTVFSFTWNLLSKIARMLLPAGIVSQATYMWLFSVVASKLLDLTRYLSALICCSVNKVETACPFMIELPKFYCPLLVDSMRCLPRIKEGGGTHPLKGGMSKNWEPYLKPP